jgi:8-oxo-dGTP pyrophosphatase MutT (NUDIX family)
MTKHPSSPWTVRASRHIHRDRWISLRADDCVTGEGVDVAPYYVLEYPDWAHVLALDEENHILLVRQYRHAYGGFTLELPGGIMDAGDESPITAAARELAEETGYTADAFRLVTSLSPNPATHTNRVHLILAQPARFIGPATPEPDENVVVVRVPVSEALRMALSGEIIDAPHVGLLMIGLHAADALRDGLQDSCVK